MKKLLPPYLFLIAIATINLVYFTCDVKYYILYPYNLIFGTPLFILGLAISVYYNRYFIKNNINIMTFDEPTKLLSTGIFKYSRHPIYLGLVLAIFGIAILYNAFIISIIVCIIFLIIIDRWYIQYEEKMMLQKFGNDYINYCQKVRRWL